MNSLAKIAGLSAVLAAGIVSVGQGTVSAAATAVPTKAFYERVGAPAPAIRPVRLADAAAAPVVNRVAKGDAAPSRPSCDSQPWPYKAAECLSAAATDAPARKVRTIALETR